MCKSGLPKIMPSIAALNWHKEDGKIWEYCESREPEGLNMRPKVQMSKKELLSVFVSKWL